MEIAFCCLWLTAMTLAGSDLSQTANFTAREYTHEKNPIIRPLVKSADRGGEIALGMLTIGSIMMMEKWGKDLRINGLKFTPSILRSLSLKSLIELGMIAGHGWAVVNNHALGEKIHMVVFPALTVRW